jgi:hypothetical protein
MAEDNSPPGQSGIAVDARGGAVIDPTKNVLDLVKAESRFQDAMRDAESKYQNGMRDSESRRQDDLSRQKERYEKQISDILTVQVKTTSELISTQLDKVTTSLAAQIITVSSSLAAQITSVNTAMDARLTPIERFRYETGGRTSVSDPAIAETLARLSAGLAALNGNLGIMQTAQGMIGGERRGMTDSNARLLSVVMAVAAVAAPVVSILVTIMVLRGHP